MFKVMGGVKGVSHVKGDDKVGGGGLGASAMFKVMAVSHVQGDDRGVGVRGISHVQGDGGE